MDTYCCTRVWQLEPGASPTELETLAASGMVEMQRWIPGVQQISLVRLSSKSRCYLMTLTFANHESYMYWRQVEEEAPDYWERYASISMHWEQLASLVEEFVGEQVVDIELDGRARAK